MAKARSRNRPRSDAAPAVKEDVLIGGMHAVAAVLADDPRRINELMLADSRDDGRLQSIVQMANAANVSIRRLSSKELDQQAGELQHQGVLARAVPQAERGEGWLDDYLNTVEQPFLLLLDCVQDPHNLGACIRSAEAAGVHAVIVPRDKAAGLNATARKVACGAAETMPVVRVANLARCMKELQERGIWLLGTSDQADESIYQRSLTGPLAIVMGAEGKGLRRLTAEHCDWLVNLPMAGAVSSLNVSVATGICLFEAVRQRQLTAIT